MYRDERYFDRPEEFLPERFLDNVHGTRAGVADDPARTDNLLFGGGKRMCPGMAVAKTTAVRKIKSFVTKDENRWSTRADHIFIQDIIGPYLLWAFDFKSARDPATGLEVPPKMEFKSVSLSVP